MAKQPSKPRRKSTKTAPQAEIPPGATRKALDRPVERPGGPPGSGGGPRHAADDIGSEIETYGRTEMTRTAASPSIDEDDALEKGPPYAGSAGGAVGGSPAQLRSAEGTARQHPDLEQEESDSVSEFPQNRREGPLMRLTGFEAIEYAEKQGLALNKHPDSITGPRIGLNVAEAEAIADEDPDLIWLDVAEEEYYSGPPSNYEPEH